MIELAIFCYAVGLVAGLCAGYVVGNAHAVEGALKEDD